MGLKLPNIKLPPPLIDPHAHPWLCKGANWGGRLFGKAAAGAIALPIAQTITNDDTPVWTNLFVAAGIGAAIGGATGLAFPARVCKEINRWEAIRSAAFDTAVGAPVVAGAAMVLANRFLGGLVEFGTDGTVRLPRDGESDLPPAKRPEPRPDATTFERDPAGAGTTPRD